RRGPVTDRHRTGWGYSCHLASDDAPTATSQTCTRRIVVGSPRLCGGAMAAPATRAATLWGGDSVLWHLDDLLQRILTCRPRCDSRSSWCCCWRPLRSASLHST